MYLCGSDMNLGQKIGIGNRGEADRFLLFQIVLLLYFLRFACELLTVAGRWRSEASYFKKAQFCVSFGVIPHLFIHN